MEYFTDVRGNAALKEAFRHRIENGSLPHAILFEGPSGCGKKAFALSVAAALACRDPEKRPCGHCADCRKLLHMQSPDLQLVTTEGDRKQIRVDAVRAMKENAAIFPNDLDFRVFVIDDASDMNVQAQNALLKLLEEPPTGVYLFLLCSDRMRLLPTVLSRVQAYRMELLPLSVLRSYFETDPTAVSVRSKDADRYAMILRAAGGSIGRAKCLFAMTPKELSEDGDYRSYEITLLLFRTLTTDKPSFSTLNACLQKNVTDRAFCGAVIDRLCCAFHDILIDRKNAPAEYLSFFDTMEQAAEYADFFTSRKAADAYYRLTNLRISLEANLNLASLLCRLAEILL